MVKQGRLNVVGQRDGALRADHVGGVIVGSTCLHVVHRGKVEKVFDLAFDFGLVSSGQTEARLSQITHDWDATLGRIVTPKGHHLG